MRLFVGLSVAAMAMIPASLVSGAALASGMRPAAGTKVELHPAGPMKIAVPRHRRCYPGRVEIYSYPPTFMFEGKHYYYYPDPRLVRVRN
jgi:hypothetical protein